jgi:hypothetical protein
VLTGSDSRGGRRNRPIKVLTYATETVKLLLADDQQCHTSVIQNGQSPQCSSVPAAVSLLSGLDYVELIIARGPKSVR